MVIPVHESFDLPIRMVEYTGVPHPSGEADLDEVGTEGLLPPLGSVPRAIQTQSELADITTAELGLFGSELDKDVPVDPNVKYALLTSLTITSLRHSSAVVVVVAVAVVAASLIIILRASSGGVAA